MENILTINDCEVLVEALDRYESNKRSKLMPENIIPFDFGMGNEIMASLKQEMEKTRQEKQRDYEEAKEVSTLLKARLIMLKKDLQSEGLNKLITDFGNVPQTKTPEQ